jgi:hypothetical protein
MLLLQGDAVDAVNRNVELTEADRIDRMRLIRSDNVGPRGIMAQTPQAAMGLEVGGDGRPGCNDGRLT